MNKNQAVESMNLLGKQRKPYIFLIDFLMQNSIIFELDKINTNKLLFNFPNVKNFDNVDLQKQFFFEPENLDFEIYKRSFDEVVKNIKLGNSYLVNLTAQVEIQTNLTLLEIFKISKAKYKLWYNDQFTFFSPESFVKIVDGKIYSYPMKGTIDAFIENAEQIILNDEKETAEHFTIVDLIRNDLNIVAKNVKVEKFRYIDHLQTSNKNLLQVSSIISGILPENYAENIGNIVFSMLPAGSISGAPKKKTVEIIVNAENYERGFYTGVAGFFDGTNLDSCVMIRFIENLNGKMFYKAGGGITSLSKVDKEYEELMNKIYLPVF